ncbi:hypothetical protein HY571_02655, partial [Candidatus Micrarchaeota archaeon]|nr:hypothetical protein [Candidatus Micrarchaeota archaeon]
PRGELTPVQRVAVEAHRAASEAWQKFLATGKPRGEGILAVDKEFPHISQEERDASAKAREALVKALALFEKRGLTESDYEALREHAAQHWHPIYAERWPQHVRVITNSLRIVVGPSLRSRIEREFLAMTDTSGSRRVPHEPR